jgi:hypothetical protein
LYDFLALGEELFPVSRFPGSSCECSLGEVFLECFWLFPECLRHLGKPVAPRSVSGMLLSKEFVDEFASQTGTKHDYIHTLQNDYDYARCPAAHRLVPCTQCTDFRRRQQDRATRVALYAPYAPAGASFFKKNISRREPCPLHVDTAAVARLVGTFMT